MPIIPCRREKDIYRWDPPLRIRTRDCPQGLLIMRHQPISRRFLLPRNKIQFLQARQLPYLLPAKALNPIQSLIYINRQVLYLFRIVRAVVSATKKHVQQVIARSLAFPLQIPSIDILERQGIGREIEIYFRFVKIGTEGESVVFQSDGPRVVADV